MNYVIYIITSKNGMSPLSVLIQPYPLLPSFPFGRNGLLDIVIRDWKSLQVLRLCQRRLGLFGRERELDSPGAGRWQTPKPSHPALHQGCVRWLSGA